MQMPDQAFTIDHAVTRGRIVHDVEVKQERGAGPFVTFRHLVLLEREVLWLARNHRRGLGPDLAPRAVWQREWFNIVMGAGFAVGSVLFALGALLALFPHHGFAHLLAENTAQIFFVGSIFFTGSAYLQLFQSANAGADPVSAHAPGFVSFLGWKPTDLGWLASALQCVGTLFFNASTYYAIQGGSWLRQDALIWGPDILGSVLFLVSGYLAVVETCHTWWSWRPRTLAWWIVMVNFLGCIAFMVSAVFAFVPASGMTDTMANLSNVFTLIGAAGFFVGAGLAMRECTKEAHANPGPPLGPVRAALGLQTSKPSVGTATRPQKSASWNQD